MSIDQTKIYIHTAGGRKVYPFAMTPEQVDIETIARHLACQSRWLGATQHPSVKNRISLSVAEHSVHVSHYLETEMGRPDLALEGLLHDAPEAYVGEMIRPLKYSPDFCEVFKRLEKSVERVVATRFNLPFPMTPLVKQADNIVCKAEWHQIVPRSFEEEWSKDIIYCDTEVTPANIGILMLPPYDAYQMFMSRFEALTSERIAA